jgi:DNA-binding NarL/FixJ family response regulator
MMDDLLEPLEGEGLQPGDLVRARPSTLAPQPSALQQLEPLGDAPENPHRVLIVDDSDDLRDVFRMKLERQPGYEVVGEAVDGVEAVSKAAVLRPDVVLLDIAMPRMDGLEALPKIREVAEGVRIVVLSGFNQTTMAEKAMAAGADRYVVKGSSMRELVGVLDTLFATV